MSTLIDLARRGYLIAEQTGMGGDDYTFRRIDKEASDLRQYERTLLNALFKGNQERSLDNLRYKFAQNLPKIRQQLYDEVVREGYTRTSPEAVRQSYGCMAAVVGVVAVAGIFFLPGLAGGIGMLACPGIGLLLTAAALLVVSRYMPAKSEKGSVAAAQWLAFKRYLRDIEKYTDLGQRRRSSSAICPTPSPSGWSGAGFASSAPCRAPHSALVYPLPRLRRPLWRPGVWRRHGRARRLRRSQQRRWSAQPGRDVRRADRRAGGHVRRPDAHVEQHAGRAAEHAAVEQQQRWQQLWRRRLQRWL